jgi:hypothetical protein
MSPPALGDPIVHHLAIVLALAMNCLTLATTSVFAQECQDANWKTIFDGKSLDGWKPNESPESWTVQDGALVGHGPRSHLYYIAEEVQDFELKADAMINHGGNSGIYFHIKQHDGGWFFDGHEIQINNTHVDPVRTGSLWHVVQFYDSPVKDDEWFNVHLRVQGKTAVVRINDKIIVEYLEPEGIPGERKIGKGFIALQEHDPGTVVRFRNIMLKKLPPPAPASK